MTRPLPAAVVVLFALGPAAPGQDLGNVPPAARAAADRAVPKVAWTAASKQTDAGDTWYDIEGTDAKGRYVCVSVRADGTVDEVSTEVEPADVPKKVTAALLAAVPGFKADAAYEARTDGKVTRYDFEGTDAQGRAVDADVSADGEVGEVSTEVPLAGVPKVVSAALAARMPRFKATAAYEVRAEGKVVRYDFDGRRPRDQDGITVSVSADGKTVTVED
jgi:hypothetical protein